MQSSLPSQTTPQPQLVAELGTHASSQQLAPIDVIEGAAQAGEDPQKQEPATQFGPLMPQTLPHAPQLLVSVCVSMHAPPQQLEPEGHAAPVLPQEHTPETQISSPGQTLPTVPQLLRSVCVLTQRKLPASLTHVSPTMHAAKLPHAHWGAPLPVVEHALARSASHAIPQPLQLVKEGSARPSAPGATERLKQVVPQQR
jgi:hypothetical protein